MDPEPDGIALSDEVVEQLAQIVHDSFLRAQRNEGIEVSRLDAGVGWDDLAEEFREQNRQQVRAIPAKLAIIGQQIVRGGQPLRLSDDDKRAIAVAEHERWMALKRAQGYVYGERRSDVEPRTHPDLKPWDDLGETAQTKDLHATDLIPMLLREAGLGVVPISAEAERS